jgi:hypothetical protein
VGWQHALAVGVAGVCLAACGGSTAAPTRPAGGTPGPSSASSSAAVGGTPAPSGASGSTATAAIGSTPASSGATPTEITLTTAANCQAMPDGFGSLSWSTLSTADSGNRYLMSRCQAIGVELLSSVSDGCGWTTVQSTNTTVLTLLPLPLPAPPPGGTFEVYGAVGTGQAMLTSTLSCPDGSTQQTWSVTVEVSG